MDGQNCLESRARELGRKLTLLLIEKKLTITTMESATGGQLASIITDTEGSSAVLKGAYITYSNEAKIKLGVAKETIDTFTVYSEQTAVAMAEACRNSFGADIGVGITGTFANVDPQNEQSSVPGEVHFACAGPEGTTAYSISVPLGGSRLESKLYVCARVCEQLLKKL